MTRNIIALSISTGIPMPYWEQAGETAIITAWEIVEELNTKKGG